MTGGRHFGKSRQDRQSKNLFCFLANFKTRRISQGGICPGKQARASKREQAREQEQAIKRSREIKRARARERARESKRARERAHKKTPAETCGGCRRSNGVQCYRLQTNHTNKIKPRDHPISIRSRSVYSAQSPTNEHSTQTGNATAANIAKHKIIILPPPGLQA